MHGDGCKQVGGCWQVQGRVGRQVVGWLVTQEGGFGVQVEVRRVEVRVVVQVEVRVGVRDEVRVEVRAEVQDQVRVGVRVLAGVRVGDMTHQNHILHLHPEN